MERAIKACCNQIEIAPEAAKAFKGESEKPIIDIDFLTDSEDEIQRRIALIEKGEATTNAGALGFLPSHHGFKQLAIILQKRGAFSKALALCEQAKAEGWKGDWDQRIAKLTKQIAKQSDRQR